MEYAESLARYGSDKPDLRYGLDIRDATAMFAASEFRVFGEAARGGGVVRALNVPNTLNRADIDKLTDLVKSLGAKGLAWIRWPQQGALAPDSPFAKFLKPAEIEGLIRLCGVKNGDTTFFGAGLPAEVALHLGALRKELIAKLKPAPSGPWSFHWIVHFPLLEWEAEEKRWTFAHNPFTSPLESELSKLDTDPGNVLSHQYDLVLNGVELASGSIRNHRAEVQRKILSLMGFSPEQQQEQFGLLLNALEYGAPPHGGVALGLDRLIAVLRGEESIREVIAFPKTQKGSDPLSEAPSPANARQLKELHIKLDLPPPL